MMTWLRKYSDEVYSALRFIAGLLFVCHGVQKYFGVLGGAAQIHTLKGLIAGTIEMFGGTLIAIGLATSIAAFVASGEMAVAYFWVHAHRSFWPIINKGELAIVFCFLFLYIAAGGSGKYSLDALLWGHVPGGQGVVPPVHPIKQNNIEDLNLPD
ncbi:MAG: DoxX family protein [Terriglobales bacterium]